VTLSDYANEWLNQRTDLAERTTELYRHVLDKHLLPVLGTSTLAGLTPTKIRSWHTNIANDHPATASKAYRLLSSIMRTAVVDGIISTSPARWKEPAQIMLPRGRLPLLTRSNRSPGRCRNTFESLCHLPHGASCVEGRFSGFEGWMLTSNTA